MLRHSWFCLKRPRVKVKNWGGPSTTQFHRPCMQVYWPEVRDCLWVVLTLGKGRFSKKEGGRPRRKEVRKAPYICTFCAEQGRMLGISNFNWSSLWLGLYPWSGLLWQLLLDYRCVILSTSGGEATVTLWVAEGSVTPTLWLMICR